jgi:DNA repair protein SbcC/Rad50
VRPLRLILDGFGTYRHETEIDFTDVDFFALVGPTGSGKSTVIDALCFALYGTVPRWDNEREVRNALAPSANACTVSLIFEISGHRYVAVRSLQRDRRGQVSTKAARLERLDASVPATASLTELLEASVEQLAEGPDQVKSRVQELLGLSYEHFTQSVLLPQGGFSEFLRATPANRQRLLVELLAFGVYKDIGQRARERAGRAEELGKAARQHRDQLAGATQEAEDAAADRLSALTGLAATVETSLAGLAELEQQAAAARTLTADAETQARLLGSLRVPADLPTLAQQITTADARLAQARIDRDEAERAAILAAQARGALPDKTMVQRHLDHHALRRELVTEADKQAAAVAVCREREEKLTAELEGAELVLAQAQQALEEARHAHAAAGLAEGLVVGEDCPVCRQRVTALPRREAPADLAAARSAVDAGRTAQQQATVAYQEAARSAASAQSAADSTRDRLEKAALVMADAPAEAVLTAQLAEIAAADEVVMKTTGAAAARKADVADAEGARSALEAAEHQAWNDLATARDKVVGLGAPAVGASRQHLAEAWTALVAWAENEREARAAKLPDLTAAATDLQQQWAQASADLAGHLARYDIVAGELAKAPALVAAERVRTEALLSRIREDRVKAAAFEQEAAARTQEAHVAAELGNLLKANRFESWLCSEALDSLITEASATLMELSGGQYELDQDARSHDLVVIDYEDAGTRRPVHTLSGGETFQASLALALALSRQVIGLSAGMRELNSMFLDEGFGTLDSDTLETVASTLERLAADSDRMVGVITHVSALAERVPVRYVVNRAGTTSTIVRERS